MSVAEGFEPPDEARIQLAIGSLDGLPESLQRAFTPGNDFDPVPAPGPGDWLAVHSERGQTFDEFRESRVNRPHRERGKLYFLPLGTFTGDPSPSLEKLEEHARVFFGMEVEVLEPLDLEGLSLTTRTNSFTGKRQVLTGDVLALLRKRLPRDAFAILAITMVDLYPEPAWNFVFGQASLRDRVGVYSFARYDPAFHGKERERGYRRKLLERSLKVLVHETAHMFGLRHCIYFRCVLNGANHLEESDSRRLHLCPVCLRKLHHSTGLDIVDRYRKLERFYRKVGLEEPAGWVAERLRKISPEE